MMAEDGEGGEGVFWVRVDLQACDVRWRRWVQCVLDWMADR